MWEGTGRCPIRVRGFWIRVLGRFLSAPVFSLSIHYFFGRTQGGLFLIIKKKGKERKRRRKVGKGRSRYNKHKIDLYRTSSALDSQIRSRCLKDPSPFTTTFFLTRSPGRLPSYELAEWLILSFYSMPLPRRRRRVRKYPPTCPTLLSSALRHCAIK